MSSSTRDVRTDPVIAIDGPAGSGKSTVSKAVARLLGWRYLDTGAMYRAVTAAVLDRGVSLADAPAIASIAAASAVRLSTDPDDAWIEVDGWRVTDVIRSRAVTNAVSAVSAVPAVRETVIEAQRQLVGAGAIVVEGRDIGTTVVPDAEVKIFLTADAAARAARRHLDDSAPEHDDLTVTHEEMARRDRFDSGRSASPMAKADDAVEIDTTGLSIDQVVAAVLANCSGLAAALTVGNEVEA